MAQKFAAREPFTYANGAIGWRPGGPMDCLGPYAKVQNCPIHGTTLRLTAYATGYADSFFSVPAETRYRGKRIVGYFTSDHEGGITFRPLDSSKADLGIPAPEPFCDACAQHKPCSCDDMEAE